jgi:hypothetical protein
VAIVSQNGAPYGLESIAAGGIKATVGWSPSQEAQLALRTLVAYIRGDKNQPKLTITPMTVITKSNVSAATPWEPRQHHGDAELDLWRGTPDVGAGPAPRTVAEITSSTRALSAAPFYPEEHGNESRNRQLLLPQVLR